MREAQTNTEPGAVSDGSSCLRKSLEMFIHDDNMHA